MTGAIPAANRASVLRRLILSHRLLAGSLIALALAMRLVMPAGVMPVAGAGKLMVLVCTEFGPQRMAIDVPGTPAKPDLTSVPRTDRPFHTSKARASPATSPTLAPACWPPPRGTQGW